MKVENIGWEYSRTSDFEDSVSYSDSVAYIKCQDGLKYFLRDKIAIFLFVKK